MKITFEELNLYDSFFDHDTFILTNKFLLQLSFP